MAQRQAQVHRRNDADQAALRRLIALIEAGSTDVPVRCGNRQLSNVKRHYAKSI